ncbi:6-phosphofructokinase [Zeaxanthinibacter enoshimensis]|uniref:6-phosphofructokinase 1 n=1 Tax=Zeaxanthinibacter enoshimensis TaxID=392009 RepID=A0A4R6TQM5_9FLAO|nr:6-phosphofructokinase [Zeaxanthinibacter enoshimensis]TDQ32423.1 6-phosphofructokinase 1 [Zeaxanthinibacter enoshimensis]
MNKSILILCGGGPAPGINSVISTVAKAFLKDGYRVLGLHEGFKGIFSSEPQIKEFDFFHADRIFSRGGSTLIMSRFKPRDEKLNKRLFSDNNVKLLVSIGGDDTASTANRITNFLQKEDISIANIHVPKTIDNDLPLPDRNPTFGFHSAKDEGVRIGNTTYEDARTSQNWFVMSAMGRSAGHLAFGIAASCHFPMMIIPEMFSRSSVTFDKVVRLVISSMIKRKLKNIHYGVAMISEGIFHNMPKSELDKCGIDFTYDDHGHPELGNVSKAHILNMLVQKKLKELGIDIKSRPVELGYELRCCRPIGLDLTLCTLLGLGVKKLFDEGKSGCMVTANSRGEVTPLYLSDIQNEEGKIAPRLVEVETEFVQLCFQNLYYLEESDYEQAKTYVPDPSEYDFHKILIEA